MEAEGAASIARTSNDAGARGEALARLRASYGWMGLPLAIALIVRLALLLIADAGVRLFVSSQFSGPLLVWMRKDADWYMTIAAHGYDYSPLGQSRANFFPLYPLAVALAQRVTGLLPLSPSQSYVLAGMLVSWLAFCGVCVVLYRLARDRFDHATAVGAVVLLAVYPFSFYYGAPYTESLFLLLVLLAFLGVERRAWWLAGVASLLAGAERPPGLIVGACVVLAYALDWLRTRHPLRWDVLALALTPLGALAYAGYCWARFGDPLAYAKTSQAGWHNGHLQSTVLVDAVKLLTHPQLWMQTRDFELLLHGIYVLLVVGFLISVPYVARLLGLPYALYTFASFAAPIATFYDLNGFGRYLSVAFPTFIVLAYALRYHPRIRIAVIAVCALALALFATQFAAGFGLS